MSTNFAMKLAPYPLKNAMLPVELFKNHISSDISRIQFNETTMQKCEKWHFENCFEKFFNITYFEGFDLYYVVVLIL